MIPVGWWTVRRILLVCTGSGGVLSGCVEDMAPTAPAAGKAMETGDTAATAAWEPGDPIPGWDDHDCADMGGAGYLDLTMPNVVYAGWGELIFGGDGAGTLTARTLQGIYADCTISTCNYLGYDESLDDTSWVRVALHDYSGDLVSRGVGDYDQRGLDRGYPQTKGHSELLTWHSVGEPSLDSVRVRLCVSSIRPDRVAWTLEVQPQSPADRGGPYNSWYRGLSLRVHYQVEFSDHAGCIIDAADPYGCVPDFGESQIGYDDISYDDAWPWDEITDPDIRDAVYERYTPWNTP